MRRWNGWGEENIDYPLNDRASEYLVDRIGPGRIIPDAKLQDLLPCIPKTKLPSHPLINYDNFSRLSHSCGHSLPDWIALRYGKIKNYTDGVACPATEIQVRELIDFAYQHGFYIIPYGGGTSVVGHINPLQDETPCITIDLHELDALHSLDEINQVAKIGTGATGPKIESKINKFNFTLGHFPQSFEYSTLGGWLATRSCGQQSYFYGRIEDMFRGGHIETPQGPYDFKDFPASAAGPDLRQIFLGSEGRMGIATEATVKIRPIPFQETFYGVFFRDFDTGIDAIQELVQSRVDLSILRLSNSLETETTLVLSSNDKITQLGNLGLRMLGIGEEKCLLIYGITARNQELFIDTRETASSIIRKHKCFGAGRLVGNLWAKSRFYTPYLRNTLWEMGYAVDTIETSLCWSKVSFLMNNLTETIKAVLEPSNEKVLVISHVSHAYEDGASIYVTYIFRRTTDWEETLNRWKLIKSAASNQIILSGGTISHQHGVGTDHIPYIEMEKGRLGTEVINQIFHTFDPKGLMNPGKLTKNQSRFTQI